MEESRCERSDLLVSQCAHCRGDEDLDMGETESRDNPRDDRGNGREKAEPIYISPEEAFSRGRFGRGRPGYENR